MSTIATTAAFVAWGSAAWSRWSWGRAGIGRISGGRRGGVTTLYEALSSHPKIAGNDNTGVGAVDRSLYERLGGTDAITAVVRAFEDRAAKDDRINQKFARTNLDRLTREFVDQLCEDTGGPCTYTGRNMKETHTNMGVTSGEFDVFMEDLVATLDDFKVGQAEQDELLNMLWPMKPDIVEVDSPQVGTPLPSAFVPAPPL